MGFEMTEFEKKVRLLEKPWDDPFARFDAFLNDVIEVIRLTTTGIGMVARFPKVFEPAALRQVERGLETAESAKTRIAQAKKDARAAEALIQNELSVVLGHMVVGIWSALEALISDIALTFLVHKPNLLATERLAKIKIPVSILNEPDSEIRMMRVIEEISQQERFYLTAGADGFENLLSLIGLSGPIDDALRKKLYETSQVRNLIVHKASVVDKKFKERCPWLDVGIGTRLEVTAERYHIYAGAIAAYASALYEHVEASLK